MNGVFILDPARRAAARRSSAARRRLNLAFVVFCVVVALVSLVVLAVMLTTIFYQGVSNVHWEFLTNPPGPDAADAGIMPALAGTVWVCVVCALTALPLGVATAVFLEEFKPKNRVLRRLHGIVQLNINNLAGVPSVVYGLIGITVFMQMFGVFGTVRDPWFEIGGHYQDFFETVGDTFDRRTLKVYVDGRHADQTTLVDGMTVLTRDDEEVRLKVIPPGAPMPDDEALRRRTVYANVEVDRRKYYESWYYLRVPFDRSVLTGGLTLMLVILPVVIIASQESIRAVPDSLREAALGMACTRWQMVRRVTLPAAVPGILTGSILALSRAIGEAAPMLMIAGTLYMDSPPANFMDTYTVMPLQIYRWLEDHKQAFQPVAGAAIIVLLGVLLTFNAVAVFLRQRLQKPLT